MPTRNGKENGESSITLYITTERNYKDIVELEAETVHPGVRKTKAKILLACPAISIVVALFLLAQIIYPMNGWMSMSCRLTILHPARTTKHSNAEGNCFS